MDDTTPQHPAAGRSPHGGLTDLLDAAIPAASTTLDPSHALHLGRRAARRRRALIGLAGSAAVLAVAGVLVGGTTLGPVTGSDREQRGAGDEAAVATGPSPAAPEATTPTPPPTRVDQRARSPYLDPDGGLVLPPGFRLVAEIVEPLGYSAPAHSRAVAYDAGDRSGERWTVLTLRPQWRTDGGPLTGVEPDGTGAYDQPADTGQGQTFEEWVQAQAAFGVGVQWPESGLPSEPYLRLDGDLVMPQGAEVVEQVENPLDLADPRSSTAIAWTPADGDGDPRWTLLVIDPEWRPADAAGGLVNGFGAIDRPAGADADFRTWVFEQSALPFQPDAPPAWVAVLDPA